MAKKIEVLWRQALNTFSGRWSENYKMCLKKFEKLKSLMDDIKAEDVYVDKKVMDYVEAQSAPMCVMDVFENEDITIAVFMLKSGVTLPMHDHPEMHGLLKVSEKQKFKKVNRLHFLNCIQKYFLNCR